MLVASFLGLFAGLALLVVLTMRGVNIIISAVLCAMLVAVCSGLPLDDAMLDSYMAGFTGFFTTWFPAILLGAIFGQLMDDSGAAKAIARQSSRWFGEKRAIMAVVGASAILTYGGVSVFVVGFSVYPIAFELFKNANLPHRFIPGAMVFGSISFTMTSPGSPEVQNLIPTEHFGTTAVAGGVIGVICALTILVLGAWAIRRCVRRAVNAGETFDPPAAARQHDRDDGAPVPTWAALLPLLVLVGGFNCCRWPWACAPWRRCWWPWAPAWCSASPCFIATCTSACAPWAPAPTMRWWPLPIPARWWALARWRR